MALTISEQTSAQPASLANSRKGKKVMPASGAKTVMLSMRSEPILIIKSFHDFMYRDIVTHEAKDVKFFLNPPKKLPFDDLAF